VKITHVLHDVIEHFPPRDPDDPNSEETPPEPFGEYLHATERGPLRIGDVIMLKWTDGRDAYRVRITYIRNGTLFVRHDDPSDIAPGELEPPAPADASQSPSEVSP
jgi:hypothetical protein